MFLTYFSRKTNPTANAARTQITAITFRALMSIGVRSVFWARRFFRPPNLKDFFFFFRFIFFLLATFYFSGNRIKLFCLYGGLDYFLA